MPISAMNVHAPSEMAARPFPNCALNRLQDSPFYMFREAYRVCLCYN